MTAHEKRRLTVISNSNYINEGKYIKEPEKSVAPPISELESTKVSPQNTVQQSFHTNPMYEKLLTYQALQKKKKFTVEDLLKW